MQVTLRRAQALAARATRRRPAADPARRDGCDELRPARGIVNAIAIALVLDAILVAGVIALIRLV